MDYLTKADLPYPEIGTLAPSEYEVRLILPAYGGRGSETTASLTYMYQYYVLDEKYREIASVLEKIAITEMHHHEILGKLIVGLGGTPYYGGNRGFWQGGFVNYTRSPKEILTSDITGEKEAIRLYQEIATRTKSETVKACVERIILDEEIHINTFNELMETLS